MSRGKPMPDIIELRVMIAEAVFNSTSADLVEGELVSRLEEAVRAYPYSATLYCLLGDLIQIGGSTEMCGGDAGKCYEQAIVLDPLCVEAYESLGYWKYTLDKPDAAVWFEKALQLENHRINSLLGLARVCADHGDLLNAQHFCDEARSASARVVKSIEECDAELDGLRKAGKSKASGTESGTS